MADPTQEDLAYLAAHPEVAARFRERFGSLPPRATLPTAPEPTLEDINYLRANPDVQQKFEARFGPASRYLPPKPPAKPGADGWQSGTARTPFVAPNVTGNQTVDTIIEPITGYAGRLNSAYTNSQAMAEHGLGTLQKGDLSGLAGVIPGVAGMVSAPISAALEPVARPINEFVSPIVEKTFGTPPEITTPALTALIPGMGITRLPGARPGPGVAPRAAPTRAQPRPAQQPAPTNESIRAQADAAYQAADDAGVIFTPQMLNRLSAQIKSELADFGYHPKLQPGAATVLEEINNAAQNGNITLKGLDTIRKIAGNAAQVTNRADVKATQKIVKNIDETMRNVQEGDVLTGNAEAGVAALNDARSAWARLAKSELIDSVVQKATRQAQSTGSGGNVENAIRQGIRRILDSPSKVRGFTAAERELMEHVVKGGRIQNLLRLTGKLSPQGNGLMAALGTAGAIANPAVGLPFAAGLIAKPIANRMAARNVQNLSEAVRRGQ